ncbi:OmpA family protein [Vibrio tritonius]|uniref:OmpA family protein n=1 Tax=Vibrio tritonius TaxID=1435069 RepID=UPI0008393F58|nr:OmpA family protein [Vibrio tritonius]
MKTKFAFTLLASIMSGMLAQSAFADVYVGGRAGYSFLDDACHQTSDCDDDSGAAGLFMGYQANDWLGVELGADWLGKQDINYMKNGSLHHADHNLSAISLAPKFSYPINQDVDLFAKVGAAYMQYGNANDVVPTGAVGAEYHISKKWDARVSYQRYQNMDDGVFDGMDTNLVSVGFSYKLGQSKPEAQPVAQTEPAPVQEAQPEPQVAPEPIPEPVPQTKWVVKEHGLKNDQGLFELNSAKLTADGKDAFNPLVATLLKYPEAQATITGYTDSTGSEKYNLQLSKKRAQAVANYLIESGVNPDKLTVNGLGEKDPIATNKTLDGRKQNRRVEITIPQFKYKVKETVTSATTPAAV